MYTLEKLSPFSYIVELDWWKCKCRFFYCYYYIIKRIKQPFFNPFENLSLKLIFI